MLGRLGTDRPLPAGGREQAAWTGAPLNAQPNYEAIVNSLAMPAAALIVDGHSAIHLAAANGAYRELYGLPHDSAPAPLLAAVLPAESAALLQSILATEELAEAEGLVVPETDPRVAPAEHHLIPLVGPSAGCSAALDILQQPPAWESAPTVPGGDTSAWHIVDAIMRTSPDGIVIIDYKRSARLWNQQYRRLWALPSRFVADSRQDEQLEYIAAQLVDGDRFRAEVQALRFSAQTHRTAWDLELRDGRLVTVSTRPLLNEEGGIWGRIWFYRDVSHRKYAAAALEQSERRFRLLAEGSVHAMVVQSTGPDRQVLYINDAASRLVDRDPLGPWPPSPSRLPVDLGLLAERYPDRLKALIEGAVHSLRCELNARGGAHGMENVEVVATRTVWDGVAAVQFTVLDITARKRMERRLRTLAATDPLTGAVNRRTFLKRGKAALHSARSGDRPISLMIADADHFKAINDQFGHEAGDFVLARIAEVMRRRCRTKDLICRLGGEEFAILMPGVSLEEAIQLADRMRGAVAEQVVQLPNGRSLSATVSIGVTQRRFDDDTLQVLLRRADEALYAAKEGGRNRVRTSAASGCGP